ncbi:MAG TPA: AI-2E family transporter [Nitrospiraceae bacterium]|nr:AI-2E family transporter [Nitrospiraceae bacterium]
MTRRQIFSVTFFSILIILIWQLGVILSPFFYPIMWAVVLAATFYPLHAKLLDRLQGRRHVAAVMMTALVMAMAVLPAVYLIFLGINEAVQAYDTTTQWFRQGRLRELGVAISQLPLIGGISQELFGRLILANSGRLESSFLEGGKAVSTFLLAQGADLAKNALLFVTDFLVMVFTLFFLFRDGDSLYTGLYEAIPLDPDHKAKIFERMDGTIRAVVQGTLVTALAQGTAAGLTYWALGVPFAIFLGALSAILSLLPFGGTAIVWIPIAMYLFFSGSIVKGLVMVAVGAGLVGLMDNLLQPLLIGTKAQLPMLFLFFASLGGLASFGLLGLFLGPILLAVLLELFRIYREEFQDQPSELLVR